MRNHYFGRLYPAMFVLFLTLGPLLHMHRLVPDMDHSRPVSAAEESRLCGLCACGVEIVVPERTGAVAVPCWTAQVSVFTSSLLSRPREEFSSRGPPRS